jgi:hypothetical protein
MEHGYNVKCHETFSWREVGFRLGYPLLLLMMVMVMMVVVVVVAAVNLIGTCL